MRPIFSSLLSASALMLAACGGSDESSMAISNASEISTSDNLSISDAMVTSFDSGAAAPTPTPTPKLEQPRPLATSSSPAAAEAAPSVAPSNASEGAGN